MSPQQSFLALFDSAVDAETFESSALSVGKEYLPPWALAVLAGESATDAYWVWLSSQVGS